MIILIAIICLLMMVFYPSCYIQDGAGNTCGASAIFMSLFYIEEHQTRYQNSM
ncbi:hypothetical protein MTR67_017115 [Solanum verrucosum]|uniref:Uncharacterized protein n=1 Tax=Solanum verrucosum TaxID=315347 RepID=A0AAF0QM46_SOLVR|nr:hypothetical protein MTR67_017115 [Solanum verrucosum]